MNNHADCVIPDYRKLPANDFTYVDLHNINLDVQEDSRVLQIKMN